MQQGRQECRPSDGPATLLSPMVATKACFALKKQLLQVVGGKIKLFLPVGAKTCFGGWAFKKQPLQVVGGPGKLFLTVGAKTCFGGEAPMQQGRQECRPSDGPATPLSPMVGMESCFFPSGPKLVLVGGLLGNILC